MTFPVHVPYRISAGWDELRPLNDPRRPHGAIDIAVPLGTPIKAPERGSLFCQIRVRTDRTEIHNGLTWSDGKPWAWRNYYLDWAGGLSILQGESGMTHVFLHVEPDYILHEYGCWMSWHEVEHRGCRYFTIWNMEYPITVPEGGEVGQCGTAGITTGPHIHYEIHEGREWIPYGHRVDPMRVFPKRP